MFKLMLSSLHQIDIYVANCKFVPHGEDNCVIACFQCKPHASTTITIAEL